MKKTNIVRWVLKPAVFIGGLVPAGLLLRDFLNPLGLGANPVEEILHRTGDWTIYFLLITLAVTPVRLLTGWGQVVRFRRMLGLFAFFYASLHFSTYLFLDLELYWPEVGEDLMKRPFITVGFTAFLILIPLAITSTKGWIKRLGGKRWQRLHQLVYVAAALGVLHYLWLVKADTRIPSLLGVILIVLLSVRLVRQRRQSRKGRGFRARTPPRRVEPQGAH